MSTNKHIENIFQQQKNIYFFIHTTPSNNGTSPSPSTQGMTASLAGVTSLPTLIFAEPQNRAENKSSEIYWGVEVGSFRDWQEG